MLVILIKRARKPVKRKKVPTPKQEKCGKCNKYKGQEVLNTKINGELIVEICNCGRPPIWAGEETIKKAEEYIKECVDDFEELVESENEKTGRVRYEKKLKVKLPKAEGLALYLGVRRETLYDWADKYSEFSNILEKINQIQSSRVIDEALAGNYNPTIAKLLLGKHGYKEQTETDITSKGEKIAGFEYVKPKKD